MLDKVEFEIESCQCRSHYIIAVLGSGALAKQDIYDVHVFVAHWTEEAYSIGGHNVWISSKLIHHTEIPVQMVCVTMVWWVVVATALDGWHLDVFLWLIFHFRIESWVSTSLVDDVYSDMGPRSCQYLLVPIELSMQPSSLASCGAQCDFSLWASMSILC